MSRTTERRPVFLSPEQWSDVEKMLEVSEKIAAHGFDVQFLEREQKGV
jgi:hypothetical protein